MSDWVANIAVWVSIGVEVVSGSITSIGNVSVLLRKHIEFKQGNSGKRLQFGCLHGCGIHRQSLEKSVTDGRLGKPTKQQVEDKPTYWHQVRRWYR